MYYLELGRNGRPHLTPAVMTCRRDGRHLQIAGPGPLAEPHSWVNGDYMHIVPVDDSWGPARVLTMAEWGELRARVLAVTDRPIHR